MLSKLILILRVDCILLDRSRLNHGIFGIIIYCLAEHVYDI